MCKIIQIFKKLSLVILIGIVCLYFSFLMLPIIINPFMSLYTNKISNMAEELCGLKLKFDKLQIITTTNFSIGLQLRYFSASLPNGENFVSAKNVTAKLFMPSLRRKELEIENFSIEDIYSTLKVKPNGEFEIVDFLPESVKKKHKRHLTRLPLGLKLSNRFNTVYIREYMLTIINLKDRKEYTVQGGNLTVKNFILDKDVKFSSVGIAQLNIPSYFAYTVLPLSKAYISYLQNTIENNQRGIYCAKLY